MGDLIRKADVLAIKEKLINEAMGDKPAMEFVASRKFLLGYMKGLFTLLLRVQQLPAIDAVEVVRCGECKHFGTKYCPMYSADLGYKDDDFCSYGKRRE